MSYSPSGQQWTIDHGDKSLTVVEQGGGIRAYEVRGVPVLSGYPESSRADGGRGQVLMPWPNRIRDGRYAFDGVDQQLPITEVSNGNAIHGLVRWVPWAPVHRGDGELIVGCTLLPQPGWPAALELRMHYRLDDDGLTVAPSATNVGDTTAPFGFGMHPYLTVGEARVDELVLTVSAGTELLLDDRLLPTGTVPVTSEHDFRPGRRIGDTVLDQGYTDLHAEDGRWRVGIRHGDRETVLWAEADGFAFAQVFTGDTLAPDRARRTGVAVEPMTCPAGAFATGESLIVLEPGQSWSAHWGITATV